MKLTTRRTFAGVTAVVCLAAAACTDQTADPAPTEPGTAAPTAAPATTAAPADTEPGEPTATTAPTGTEPGKPTATTEPAAPDTVPVNAGLAANNTSSDSTTGITDDTIKVAFLGVDFSALSGTGLVPELGDQQKQVESFVAEINENGGIGGRQIELHFHMFSVLEGGADTIQAACIGATQEFQAAVVILPPAAARDLTRCTAVTNQTLTMYATGMDDPLYAEAQGRLFTPGNLTIDRQYRAWATALDEAGVLEGTTIGIVSSSTAAEFLYGVEEVLVPTLEELGHAPAEVIAIPCEGTSCQQYDVAAQRMKDAGVDLVFQNIPNNVGVGLVQASADIDFAPQWVALGNQATDTVSNFYAAVAEHWDGMIGLGFSFNQPDDLTPTSAECNAVVTERSGEFYEPGTDAYGFTANICNMFLVVDRAADSVEGSLTQGSLIAAIQGLGTFEGFVSQLTLSPTKHDGLDEMFWCDYTAEAGVCVRRDGPRVVIPD